MACHANNRPSRLHRLVRTGVVSAIFTVLHAVKDLSLMLYCGTWGIAVSPAEGTVGFVHYLLCCAGAVGKLRLPIWHSIEWCAIAHRLLLSHLVLFYYDPLGVYGW